MVPDGYRVVWKHFRPKAGYTLYFVPVWQKSPEYAMLDNGLYCRHYTRGKTYWEPALRGGVTRCYIYDDTKELVAIGEAQCSLEDQFVYRIGREISLGRALKNLIVNA